jgi:predicted outer membrane protein
MECEPPNFAELNANRTSKKSGNTLNKSGMTMNNNETGKDNDFVKDASSGGMMEVELGKYAEEKALNPRVKNFSASNPGMD